MVKKRNVSLFYIGLLLVVGAGIAGVLRLGSTLPRPRAEALVDAVR